MRMRLVIGVLITSLALLVPQVRAQGFGGGGGGGFGGDGQGPTEEQLQMFQEMQGNFQQMMDNMQAKGIDPMDLRDQVVQQMQDGTFDPSDFQQMLIDKGIMDQQLATKMQGTTQKLMLSGIRQQLGSTDEEWKVLLPKMQRLVAAMSEVGQMGQSTQGGGGMAMMGMIGGQATGPTAKAWKDLRAAVKDKQLLDAQLAIKLREWRAAHDKAKADLNAAQDDLRSVVTLRQEAILMEYGILN